MKTIIGSVAQVLQTLTVKFNKRLYLGQLFKIEDKKYVVNELRTLYDGRILVTLKEK